jgi:hypothetical protein
LLVNTAVCRKVKPLLRHYSPSLLKMRSAGTSAAAISLLAGILALQKCVYGGMVVEAGMTPVVCHSLTEVHAERSRQREEKITVEDKEDMSMDVRIDLYPNRATGAYTLDVIARPEGLASPTDLAGQSADLILDDTPPRGEAQSISFTRAVPSPCSLATLAQPGRVVMSYLYHPLDEATLFAFDARITEEYTAFYAARGVSYMGTFRVVGPDGPCLGEFVVFETASQAEAERLGEEDLPARIVAIEDECRTLQDRERRRYVLWLIPR